MLFCGCRWNLSWLKDDVIVIRSSSINHQIRRQSHCMTQRRFPAKMTPHGRLVLGRFCSRSRSLMGMAEALALKT